MPVKIISDWDHNNDDRSILHVINVDEIQKVFDDFIRWESCLWSTWFFLCLINVLYSLCISEILSCSSKFWIAADLPLHDFLRAEENSSYMQFIQLLILGEGSSISIIWWKQGFSVVTKESRCQKVHVLESPLAFLSQKTYPSFGSSKWFRIIHNFPLFYCFCLLWGHFG